MKLNYNRKYTIIAIYFLTVFFLCLVIYQFVFNWDETMAVVNSYVGLLSPFVIALLLAYFISPMLNFFELKVIGRFSIGKFRLTSHKIQRGLSILISFIIVIGTLVFLLAIIIPQLLRSTNDIINKMPTYIERVMTWTSEVSIRIGESDYVFSPDLVNNYLNQTLPSDLETLTDMIANLAPNILNITMSIANGILNIILGFIVAIYILFFKESYIKNTGKIITALLPLHQSESLFATLKDSHRIFSKFFVGKLIDSIIIGLMCFVLMLMIKIPYPMLISVLVGITNIIPYFGPFIGGGIGFILLLIASPVKALWFGLLIIGLQQFDGNILGPKILGDSTGLTPFWVIFSIVLFGGIFGVWGMFIGVPCFAVIKNIFDKMVERKYAEKISHPEEPQTDQMSL